MKVIDILLEAELPGGVSGKLARLILPSAARTWNAEKQAAFREAVKALEETLYLARSQPTPIVTSNVDAYKVINKAAPAHVADVEFAQAVFRTAEERVAQRIAAEDAVAVAQAAKGKETTNATKGKEAATTTDAAVKKAAFNTTKKVMAGSFWAALGLDVSNDVYEYVIYQQEFLRRTKLPKNHPDYMSPENAMKADVQQKTILIQKIAAATVLPGTVLGLTKLIGLLASTPFSWLSRALTFVSPNAWANIKKLWAVKRPAGMSDAEYASLLKLTDAKWENLSSSARSSILTLWLAVLNSNERYAGAANWKIKNADGSDTGYTVGTAPGGAQPDGLTPKEMIAFYAINSGFGNDFSSACFEGFQAVWNFVTPSLLNYSSQKQQIQKAAGQAVTPNTVAKPPKKEKIGNTTWHGDWED